MIGMFDVHIEGLVQYDPGKIAATEVTKEIKLALTRDLVDLISDHRLEGRADVHPKRVVWTFQLTHADLDNGGTIVKQGHLLF